MTTPRSNAPGTLRKTRGRPFTVVTAAAAGTASGASRARHRAELTAAGQAKIEAHLDEAIDALVRALHSSSHTAAVRAAVVILERALGAPASNDSGGIAPDFEAKFAALVATGVKAL